MPQSSGAIVGLPGVITIQSKVETPQLCKTNPRRILRQNSAPVKSNDNISYTSLSCSLSPKRQSIGAGPKSPRSAPMCSKIKSLHTEVNQTHLYELAKARDRRNSWNCVDDFLHCSSVQTHQRCRTSFPNFGRPKSFSSFAPNPKRSSQSATLSKRTTFLNSNHFYDKNNVKSCPLPENASTDIYYGKERTVRFSTDGDEVYEYELNEPLCPGLGSTLELRETLNQ